MARNNDVALTIRDTHSDGSPAVRSMTHADRSLYEALDTLGHCVGVYDKADHARSAAHWARDFLLEQPNLPRMALMQLILDKLCSQYPDDTAEAVLGATGE